MAPHRALTVSDILHEVFKHFSIRPQLSLPGAELGSFEFPNESIDLGDFQASKAKKLTLARAARTCKAFADPASRVLWEVLDDLGPIESMIMNLRTSPGEENTVIWERIEHVSRRVRALTCWVHGKRGDDKELYPICSRYDGRPLFPSLRILCVGRNVDGASWSFFLRAACASSRLVLFTTTMESHITTPQLFTAIADTQQELIHLKAEYLRGFGEESHRALAKFSNLRTTHFMAIDTTLFYHLAALPNLRTLHGRFVLSNPTMDVCSTFPALEELSTADYDLDERTDLLAALPFMSSQSFTSLSLNISVPITEDMAEYLDELCSSLAVAHLHKLDLRVNLDFNQFDNDEEPFKGVDFASDVLTSLKRLSALTDISIDVFFRTSTIATFAMNDEDLDTIASAWPDITRAKFSHTIEIDEHPGGIRRPSLSAVVALGERCRQLKSIEVEFANVDSGALAQLQARADACTSPQTALRRLVFDPDTLFCAILRLENPPRLAAALQRLFPNLRSGLEVVQAAQVLGKSPSRLHVGPKIEVYRGWHHYMDTDAYRLMKALDDVDLDG